MHNACRNHRAPWGVLASTIVVVALSLLEAHAIPYRLGPSLETERKLIARPPTTEQMAEFLRLGQYEKVIFGGKLLLDKDPTARVHGMQAVAYAGTGRAEEAAAALAQAKTRGEPRITLYEELVQAYGHRAAGRQEAVAESCQRALTLAPEFPLAHCILALSAIDQGDLEGADRHAERALALEPALSRAHSIRASILIKQGKVTPAILAYQAAAEADPTDFRPPIGLAEIFASYAMFDLAIREYEAAARIYPNYAHPREELTSLYRARGQLDRALKVGREAVELNPKSARAQLNLARAYLARGKPEEASTHLKICEELVPGSKELAYFRGLIFLTPKDYDAAREEFRGAAEGDQPSFGSVLALGLIAHLQGNFQEAATQLEKAETLVSGQTKKELGFYLANIFLSQKEVEKVKARLAEAAGVVRGLDVSALDFEKHIASEDPHVPALVNLAQFYTAEHLTDQAIATCETVLKSEPENIIALHLKGNALVRKKDTAAAIATFRKMTEAAPSYTPGYLALAQLLTTDGSHPLAIEAYRKTLETVKDPAATYLKIGIVHKLAGQDAEAEAMFRRVMELKPSVPHGYHQLAQLFAERGHKLKEALELAETANILQPNNSAVIKTLGIIELKLKDYRAAIREFLTAINLIPYDPELHYQLGLAYSLSGEPGNALPALRRTIRLDPQSKEAGKARELIEGMEKGKEVASP